MFNSIKLENFRKVTSDTMVFTPGVNAIRGANEASKSTRLEAIAYAMFGARALKEPLCDVVTYGLKESELKVVLTFTVNSVVYTLKRSKSGAELTFGVERVTGQTEVTRFVESLLGANAEAASKLMLAKQSAVTGALADGPAGMVKLIETLANFDLITNLIDLAQEKLPSGNTISIETQILEATEAANEVITNEIEAKQAAVDSAKHALGNCSFAVNILKESLPDLVAIDRSIQELRNLNELQERTKEVITQCSLSLLAPMPENGNEEAIAKYEKALAEQSSIARALTLKRELELLESRVTNRKQEPQQDIETRLSDYKHEMANLVAVINSNTVKQACTKQAIITDTTCGLCGKDLTDVPEVVANNSKHLKELEGLKSEYTVACAKKETLAGFLSNIEAVLHTSAILKSGQDKASEYITLDTSYTPPKYTWRGPTQPDFTDFNSLLKVEKRNLMIYATEEGKRKQVKLTLDIATQDLKKIPQDIDARLEALLKSQEDAILASEVYNGAVADCAEAERQLQVANAALDQEVAVYAEACKRVSRAKLQLANAQAALEAQNFNNILIKKLRSARPKIADKLWGMVLSSVSTYFSAIRGETSVVSKSTEGFRVNGRPVMGLSGSTQDALGLAIRVALTKTFLPNARFLILDEVASGMDDIREAALLGMVASCGMDQVILVTHSVLADAFAGNVITL